MTYREYMSVKVGDVLWLDEAQVVVTHRYQGKLWFRVFGKQTEFGPCWYTNFRKTTPEGV